MDFTTSRLEIRKFAGCDENIIRHMLHDSLVNKYTIWDATCFNSISTFMAKYDYHTITTHNYYDVVGFCRLNEIKEGVYNVGYYLRSDRWGNGYATEVALGLMKYAFENLKARKVVATCDPRNVHSERVMKRCGMVYEGHVREDILLPNGKYRDSLYYSLLRHEFENL